MGHCLVSINPTTDKSRSHTRSARQQVVPRKRALGVFVLACLASASAVRAQNTRDTLSLSLANVRRLAVRSNPELLAARLDTAIARGELRQAGVLRFNPSADALGASGGIGTETSISQEIEVFGQRGARLSAGRAGVERARFGVTDATRRLIGEVDRNFYQLAAAVRRNALADEILALNERLADVAGRQLEGGEISRLDYNLAIVELGRSRARVLAEQRQVRQVTIELARLAGLASGAPIVPLLDSTQHPPRVDSAPVRPIDLIAVSQTQLIDVDSLTAVAVTQRPDLSERVAALRQANAQVGAARREGLPNLLLRGTSEPNATGSGRALRPGVGLTLPIFNRNQGEVAARQAGARQAELDRAALLTRVRAEVESAVATYQSAATEVEVLEATVLGPARQNRQLLEIAYREGEVGLPVLLLIRNQVIDAELAYWSAWLAERAARAVLDEVTGLNISELPNAPPDGGVNDLLRGVR